MKKIVIAGVVALLAGCASSPAPSNLREFDLRKDAFFRGDQKFSMTLAEVQRNLFRNKELCGGDFVWRLDPNQISYGTVIYQPHTDAPLSQSVLVDLTSFSNGNILAKAYSYYASFELNPRDVLNGLADPTICPMQTSE